MVAPMRLLLVDDELLEARLLKANLDRRGRLRVELATSGEEAISRLSSETFDGVLTDLSMPGMGGIELVKTVRAMDAALPIFIFTAYATLEKAVEGIHAGATDFLPKPVNVDALMVLLERAVAERPLREELVELQERRSSFSIEDVFVGSHPKIEEVRTFAQQISRVPRARVLVTGESGTGKSMLARAIHDLSPAGGRFVEVNCASLPAHLLESELFGHEKGAFTDAKSLKRGLIESADRGTLFLDEIGAMSSDLQAKLLHILESQGIRRVGGVHEIPVTARFIAATNEDLRQLVADQRFRADLYYRLEVASIAMPPLREIASAIPEITENCVCRLCGELRRSLPPLDPQSLASLSAYPWPGNVRELRNAIERALIFHDEGPLQVVPPSSSLEPTGSMTTLPPGLTLEEAERRYLAVTLERNGDRPLEETAQQLGISRKTLWEKRRRYGL